MSDFATCIIPRAQRTQHVSSAVDAPTNAVAVELLHRRVRETVGRCETRRGRLGVRDELHTDNSTFGPRIPITEHSPAFYHAFEFSPLIISIHHGPQHTVLYANAAARETSQTRVYTDLPLLAVFPEMKATGIVDLFDEAYVSGRTIAGDVRRITEFGTLEQTERLFQHTIVPRLDGFGGVAGVTAFVQRMDAGAEDGLHG